MDCLLLAAAPPGAVKVVEARRPSQLPTAPPPIMPVEALASSRLPAVNAPDLLLPASLSPIDALGYVVEEEEEEGVWPADGNEIAVCPAPTANDALVAAAAAAVSPVIEAVRWRVDTAAWKGVVEDEGAGAPARSRMPIADRSEAPSSADDDPPGVLVDCAAAEASPPAVGAAAVCPPGVTPDAAELAAPTEEEGREDASGGATFVAAADAGSAPNADGRFDDPNPAGKEASPPPLPNFGSGCADASVAVPPNTKRGGANEESTDVAAGVWAGSGAPKEKGAAGAAGAGAGAPNEKGALVEEGGAGAPNVNGVVAGTGIVPNANGAGAEAEPKEKEGACAAGAAAGAPNVNGAAARGAAAPNEKDAGAATVGTSEMPEKTLRPAGAAVPSPSASG